jgi:group I intron endonuclease
MHQKVGTIYITTNLVNGKQNIGQTTRNLKRRMWEHKNGGYLLHKAIKKYGFENFKVISFSCPEENLDWTETFLIKELNTQSPNGYNLQDGGHKNKHQHEISKQKMSEKAKKRWKNLEERKKDSERMKKYYQENPEIKENISKKLKNYFEIFENRVKSSKAHKGTNTGKNNPWFGKGYLFTGQNNHFYGKHHTQKNKDNHSKFMKGRYTNENHPRAKKVILVSPKGKWFKLLCYTPFCLKNNLNPGCICNVLQGKQKHHKGWTGKYLEEKNGK